MKTKISDQDYQVKVAPIGSACSVFSVNYCLLSVGNQQFAAYYDENRRITVAARRCNSPAWDLFQPEGFWQEDRKRFSHQTDFDSHNYLTMAVDRDGYLHVSGNMHVDPLIYFRSEKPLDISSLRCVRQMVGEREERVTYPLFFKDHQGNLLFRFRDGRSGNGDDIYNIYDTAARSWRRLMDAPLLNGQGERNGYARLPIAGPDGYWHMVWVWRESPHCETCNNLSYARSRDLIHWQRSDGTPLALPITRSTGEIIDPVAVKGGLINMSQELAFTSSGRPVITYHRYDDQGRSQAYVASADKGEWRISQLSQWRFRWDFKGEGSIPPDVIISAAQAIGGGMLKIDYQSIWGEPGTWIVDENTLDVREQLPFTRSLPDAVYQPNQAIHADAVVQILPGIRGEDGKVDENLFLRWESLPIARDVSLGAEVKPTTLEVICRNPPSGS
ncbi:BNR repeat-containing protein [Telmatospirillum sp.]|uniref:BNR repeat-containing protein n=1 Tax=Telmatospirillum sp. TaxID=2079197 RepID=UPI002851F801|nr:BNR repeat-containing protein [Telmatospirillum sp.]MDR3439142.1 BNR repeat-containing protein [Telmatospirillum sp.]